MFGGRGLEKESGWSDDSLLRVSASSQPNLYNNINPSPLHHTLVGRSTPYSLSSNLSNSTGQWGFFIFQSCFGHYFRISSNIELSHFSYLRYLSGCVTDYSEYVTAWWINDSSEKLCHKGNYYYQNIAIDTNGQNGTFVLVSIAQTENCLLESLDNFLYLLVSWWHLDALGRCDLHSSAYQLIPSWNISPIPLWLWIQSVFTT